jgi:hypothetical protein
MVLSGWRIFSTTLVTPIDFVPRGKLTYDRVAQTKLTTLDVGNNSIPEMENLSHLTHLTELWVRIYPSRVTLIIYHQRTG